MNKPYYTHSDMVAAVEHHHHVTENIASRHREAIRRALVLLWCEVANYSEDSEVRNVYSIGRTKLSYGELCRLVQDRGGGTPLLDS